MCDTRIFCNACGKELYMENNILKIILPTTTYKNEEITTTDKIELLKNINLNEKGIILSYLFDNKRKRKYEKIFFEEEFILDYLTPNDCALVYKKVK